MKRPKPHPGLPAKVQALLERVVELTEHQVMTGEAADRIDKEVERIGQQVSEVHRLLREQNENVWYRRVNRFLQRRIH